MNEEKRKQVNQSDAIALPPLKMVLVHAKNERLNKVVLQPAIKEDSVAPIDQEEQVKAQSLIKIIEHLEKKP
jgi:hypothetical protein